MKKLAQGFTLVELLIVIALLGVIATIVIAAINPIEQANRARDAGYKADASQLLSAIERYFAAKSDFPWVVVDSATYANDDTFGYVSAANVDVGVCGSSCTADGELINALELKPEFKDRDFIKKEGDAFQELYVGKDAGSSASVYACYVPMSKSNRDTACTNDRVYTLGSDGTRTTVTCTSSSTWPTGASTPWVACVPE